MRIRRAMGLGLVVALWTGGACAQEKPFTVAIAVQPDVTDPLATASTTAVLPVFGNVQEGLIAIAPDGGRKPGLASWTISNDGKVVDFKLRSGVTFSNGDPLTADDAIFSHERGAAKSVAYKPSIAGINHVEKLDNLSFRFVFDRPNIGWLTQVGFFVGDKAYHDRVGEQEYVAHPIGTGPYRITDYKFGQYFDLEARSDYWGGKPQIGKARFAKVADDATSIQMLKAGEADMIYSTPYNQVEALKAAGFHATTALVTPEVAINFQMYDPDVPWAKVKVREAIAHAIDNKAIITGLLGGVPGNFGLLTPGELGYDPALQPWAYDPALAKKLLAEAGYPNGFKMPYGVPVGVNGQRETAEAVSLYLKAVGIELDVKTMDSAASNGILFQHGKDPAYPWVVQRLTPLANNGDPAAAMAYLFSKTSAGSIYKPSDPDFDATLAEAGGTLDDAKRGALIKKLLRDVYDDVGIIPLWNVVNVNMMKPAYSFTPIQHQMTQMHLIDVVRH